MNHTFTSKLREDDRIRYTLDRLFDAQKIRDANEEMEEFENHRLVRPSHDFNQVESDYKAYLSLPISDRLHCDSIAMKIFRKTNTQIYNLLKHVHYSYNKIEPMIREIDQFGREIHVESVGLHQELCDTMDDYRNHTLTNTERYHIFHNNMLGLFDPQNCEIDKFVPSSLPSLTPGEMLEMGAFTNRFGESKVKDIDGVPIKEWFDNYCALYDGIKTETFLHTEPARIKLLQQYPDDRQTLLDLGENPFFKYSDDSTRLATGRFIDITTAKYDYVDIVDFTSFVEDTKIEEGEVVSEDYKATGIHPIFLVFAAGTSWFNKITKKMTGSVYTHVSLGFDHKLRNLYSFFIARKGFGTESILTDFKHDNYVNVVCYFVSDEQYKKMKHEIINFNRNQKKTSYGFRNFINCLTKVKNENSFSMVCSGFVTYMMKIGSIAPTKKSFSVVSPGHLRRAVARNTKLRAYDLYKGPADKYDHKKIKKKLDQLIAQSIQEDMNLDNMDAEIKALFKEIVEPYISTQVIQERTIEVDDNGDLLIDRKEIDFEKEYAKSHRLLLQYHRSHNYESMKYELAKLYYMNEILEDRIYHDKSKNKDADIKVRARILNDYNKYLKVVLDHDRKFNFDEYYKSTPYGDDRLRIKRSTVNFVIDTVKRFIKP